MCTMHHNSIKTRIRMISFKVNVVVWFYCTKHYNFKSFSLIDKSLKTTADSTADTVYIVELNYTYSTLSKILFFTIIRGQ